MYHILQDNINFYDYLFIIKKFKFNFIIDHSSQKNFNLYDHFIIRLKFKKCKFNLIMDIKLLFDPFSQENINCIISLKFKFNNLIIDHISQENINFYNHFFSSFFLKFKFIKLIMDNFS